MQSADGTTEKNGEEEKNWHVKSNMFIGFLSVLAAKKLRKIKHSRTGLTENQTEKELTNAQCGSEIEVEKIIV